LSAVTLDIGCASTPRDAGRKELITGTFLSETEIARVADLMARDILRERTLFDRDSAPRLALVRVENDTNQYLFDRGRTAYLDRLRTSLQRALGQRVRFVDTSVEQDLRTELAKWHLDEDSQKNLVQGQKRRYGVDYLLGATFSSLDKVVQVADKKGKLNDRTIIELQMTFYLVDAETSELVWQNNVTSAASYSTRDFHN